MLRTSSKRFLVLATLGLASIGCGDDKQARIGGEGSALWMLQTRVFSDESTMGYAIAQRELKGAIGNAASVEQGGGGMVYAAPGAPNGSFLLSYAEKPTLTRYTVTDDDRFEEGLTLSFANFGVESGYGTIAWVDPHTAYWLDNGALQVIRFDPTDMVVGEALSIEGIEKPGFVTELSGYPVVRDDGVYFTVRWRKDWEDPAPEAPAGAALVHIDPRRDELTVTNDERCTSLLIAKTTSSGDTYFFSDNYNTYARIIGGAERGVPDCVLRLRAGESTFDPDYYVDLADRTGGRPADGVVVGRGSTVWLNVFHEEEVATTPAEIGEADVAAGWRWYALDVESEGAATPDEQRPAASHGAFGWYSDGRSFTSTVTPDYSETTLLEVTDDGFTELATVEGLLDGLVRVR
jgi:hypothetical protein